ncbi:hypothetical protein KC878_02300 [Candidatus Saccharibacteria bacterium]|nr:hypothetical protein [Candidatus Saccharibacteria bacterium]MCB9821074.1 hypothetical protein [Candidatus Nomurabacteria bacterium]
MKSQLILVIVAGLGALVAAYSLGWQGAADKRLTNSGVDTSETVVSSANCLSEDCLKVADLEYPAGELPKDVISALNVAIDDEYKARATYSAVISKLGSIRPFSMIIRAEEQHISSLKAIYDKYGLEIPDDPYTDVQVAATKAANCSVGVQAEIDNAALYRDSLLPRVSAYPDITSVFTSLMNASQNNHLPAFERCAS